MWRVRTGAFLKRNHLKDTDDLKRLAGGRWAWHFQEQILAEPLPADFVHDSFSDAMRESYERWNRDCLIDRAKRGTAGKVDRIYILKESSG